MIVKTKEQFLTALDAITDEIVLDVETSGLNVWQDARVCGVGICTSKEETFYFPFRHRQQGMAILGEPELVDNEENLPIKALDLLLNRLKSVKTIIGHNIKFDISALFQDHFDIEDSQRIEDTVTMARLHNSDKHANLDLESVTERVLNLPAGKWKTEFNAYLKKNNIKEHYDYGDIDIVGEYCENDCLMTWRIRQKLWQFIKETKQEPVWEQECELNHVLWDIEKEGMFIDLEYCHRKIPLLEARVAELESQIFEIFGYEFDINSTSQLDKAMASIGIYSPLVTPKQRKGEDQSKWNIEVLLGIEHPVAKLVLQYREVYKMLNTYFLPATKWADGYIHPSYKSSGTATGRMSCTRPNLQNVMTKPIDVEGEKVDEKVQAIFKTMSKSSSVSSRWIARITKFEEKETSVAVKRMYIAPPGYHFYAIDFSQMEMRVFSDFVGDPEVLDALEAHNFDFHSFVATQVWNVTEDDPNWKFYRSIAKAINFGMIYGIGVTKLSKQIDKSIEEATTYKDNYFKQFPSALSFMNNVKRKVVRDGFITNKFSRRYIIPYDKSYTGVNYLVQGSSADLVKNRMIAIWKFLKPYKSRMVAQIHDEIIFYIHESEEHWIVNEIKSIMEKRLFKVLLPTEVSKGFYSWSEKSGVCLTCFEKLDKDVEHICQNTSKSQNGNRQKARSQKATTLQEPQKS